MSSLSSFREDMFANRKIVYVQHILLIIFTWIVSKYFAVGPYLIDNEIINNYFSGLIFLQTLFLYYFFSLYVFPKYLYTKRVIAFILCFLLCFLVTYWSNYISIRMLLPFSDAFKPHGSKEVWIIKISDLLINRAGWFGCFTSPKVAFWHYGLSFFIVTVYWFVKVFRDILSIQKKNLTLERDNLALELNFLKSQINPHFLFNTLNSIYNRTVDIDEQASDLVLKLSDLMRYSLYGVNEEKVPMREEMEYIQNYLDLERYRHSQKLVHISFAMEGEVEGYKIAPLLLISFVENAFKHGVNLSRRSSFVHVSVVIEDDTLHFSIQNSLPEPIKDIFSGTVARKSGGIGILNTRKRLNLLYQDRHTLDVSQTDEEYEVSVSIRLDKI